MFGYASLGGVVFFCSLSRLSLVPLWKMYVGYCQIVGTDAVRNKSSVRLGVGSLLLLWCYAELE